MINPTRMARAPPLNHGYGTRLWRCSMCLRPPKVHRSQLSLSHHTQSDQDQHLPTYVRVTRQYKSRSLSSWGKSSESCSGKRFVAGTEEQDWYGRWERDKRKQYEKLIEQMEKDPYFALFGESNRLLGWLRGKSISKPKDPCESEPPIRNYARQSHISSAKTLPTSSEVPGRSESMTGSNLDANSSATERVDYDIDPITLRKVPKPSGSLSLSSQSPSKQGEGAVQINVKKYREAKLSDKPGDALIPSSQADEPANYPPRDWLGKEGFRMKIPVTVCSEKDTSGGVKPNSSSKLESALERHVKNRITDSATRPDAQDGRTAGFPTNEADSSDDGSLPSTTSAQESQTRVVPPSKREQRKALEKTFAERSPELEKRLADEIASSRTQASFSNLASDASSPSSSAQSSIHRETFSKIGRAPRSSTGLGPDSTDSTDSTPLNKAIITSNKVSKIRAKLVPLKSKIDSLSEDYSALRKRLIEEKRRIETAKRRDLKQRAQVLLETEIKTQRDAMQSMEVERSTRSPTFGSSSATSNVDIQGEGDMASNVHEFANRGRWYKRKAPHAGCEMNAKLQRLSKEKAFVRTIRDIYEETYGIIDTKHRQPAEAVTQREPSSNVPQPMPEANAQARMKRLASYLTKIIQRSSVSKEFQRDLLEIRQDLSQLQKETGEHQFSKMWKESLFFARRVIDEIYGQTQNIDVKKPAVPVSAEQGRELGDYRILAYDKGAQKVTSAKIEFRDTLGVESMSTSKSLTKIRNASKFLPHLTSLQAKGYDVVSGSKDVLIFKKVRDAAPEKSDFQRRPNPIDGTTTPEVSAGNFASPTGYVNYGPPVPPEERKQRPAPAQGSKEKVQRLEDVFSGTSTQERQAHKRMARKAKRKARRRQTLKRMLLTGVVTAAACYGIGMGIEMTQV